MRVMPLATAPADPPEEPPGTRSGASGFRAGPYALFSVDEPIANSSMFDLATITAPARRRRAIAVASYGLTYPSRMREPQEVGSDVVAMLSFTTTGTPSSGAVEASRSSV